MFRIASILHPTDVPPISEHAFHLACALARDHQAGLIVLHVAVPPIVGYGGAMRPPPEGDWAALEEQLHRIQAPGNDVRIEYRLEVGDPAEEILRAAHDVRCDLIVMDYHGRTGLKRLLMGSVAEQVVRHAACAVLVIRGPETQGQASGSALEAPSASTGEARP